MLAHLYCTLALRNAREINYVYSKDLKFLHSGTIALRNTVHCIFALRTYSEETLITVQGILALRNTVRVNQIRSGGPRITSLVFKHSKTRGRWTRGTEKAQHSALSNTVKLNQLHSRGQTSPLCTLALKSTVKLKKIHFFCTRRHSKSESYALKTSRITFLHSCTQEYGKTEKNSLYLHSKTP